VLISQVQALQVGLPFKEIAFDLTALGTVSEIFKQGGLRHITLSEMATLVLELWVLSDMGPLPSLIAAAIPGAAAKIKPTAANAQRIFLKLNQLIDMN
jgi:hypothetical protein